MLNTKRLFLAIKIQANAYFSELMNQLKEDLKHESIKWVEQDNLHLTLKFFGETPVDQIDLIVSVLSESINSQQKFSLNIENIGVFGSSYQPKLIWAGIENADVLKCLWESIQQQLKMIDYGSGRQNFVPHLTLGRIRSLNDKSLFQQIIKKHKSNKFQTFKVDRVILYESVLKSGGAVHSMIQEFPFS